MILLNSLGSPWAVRWYFVPTFNTTLGKPCNISDTNIQVQRYSHNNLQLLHGSSGNSGSNNNIHMKTIESNDNNTASATAELHEISLNI